MRLAQMGIAAITFDLDDTLWPLEPVITQAENAFYTWLQQHCPAVTQRHDTLDLRRRRMDFLHANPHLKGDVTASRLQALRHELGLYGYDVTLADQAMQVFLAQRNAVSLFAEVSDALQELSFHYRLGTLTNGNADIQLTSVGHHFDSTLAATLELPPKPAPDMFALACEQLGVQPAAILHVGDNPATDIEGARNFGCRTAWIDRFGMQWPEELARADIEIRDLSELVGLAPARQ